MTLKITQKVKINVLLLTIASLTACGGGDDGGTADNNGYKGVTNQAVLSSANLTKLTPTKTVARAMIYNSQADGIIEQSTANFVPSISTNSAVNLPGGTAEKNCLVSGTKIEKIDHLASSLERAYTLTLNNCSDVNGVTLNGFVSAFILQDPVNPEKNQFRLSFNNYSVKSSSEYTVQNGELSFTGSDVRNFLINMVIDDKNSNKMSKLEDLSLVITKQPNQLSVDVSGKIYQSDLGYLVIETPNPIVTLTNESFPSSGELLFTGVSPISGAQEATIKISFLNVSDYLVDVKFNSAGISSNDFSLRCQHSATCTLE